MLTVLLLVLSAATLVTACMLTAGIRTGLFAGRRPQQAAKVTRSTMRSKLYRYGYHHYVEVSFDYSVDGPRAGTCILPSFLGTSREHYARRLFAHFHEGASVIAYVNPKRPERAVLLPGVEHREWALLIIMIIVTVGSAV